MRPHHRLPLTATLCCLAVTAAGCGQSPATTAAAGDAGAASAAGSSQTRTTSTGPTYQPVPEATTPATAPRGTATAVEVEARSPRIAVTYDGGVLVLDGLTAKVLGDLPAKGFTRLNAAGDERHLFLTEGDEFRVLDLGAWSEPHGDHAHRYAGDPRPTDIAFTSKKPGHVVVHDGTTVLYGDGNGKVESFDSAAMQSGTAPTTQIWTDPKPHHGVAVLRADGSLVTSKAAPPAKPDGVVILDAARTKIAENSDCPGLHGEAAAADHVLAFGCENGILIVKGSQFTKVVAPDPYGRIGNQAGSAKSPIVLGDYKVDKGAELERPQRISLTDTRTNTLRLLDLPASYSFRSLRRAPDGAGLVLGTDGVLRVIDVTAGKIATEIPVTKPWEEPKEWQKPRPAIHVQDGTAYVTEPADRLLHLVDLASGSLVKTVQLPRVPNEINGTLG